MRVMRGLSRFCRVSSAVVLHSFEGPHLEFNFTPHPHLDWNDSNGRGEERRGEGVIHDHDSCLCFNGGTSPCIDTTRVGLAFLFSHATTNQGIDSAVDLFSFRCFRPRRYQGVTKALPRRYNGTANASCMYTVVYVCFAHRVMGSI